MFGALKIDIDTKHLLEVFSVIKQPGREVAGFVRPNISWVNELKSPK